MLDTPGFDDSNLARENIDILNDIVSNLYMFALQRSVFKLRGVIFLHDIAETRFCGSQAKTLGILKALCGNECMGNVIIGTTMWDLNQPKMMKEERREKEFCEKHWKGIYKTTQLFEDDQSAATQIILDLLALPPVLLRVQQEMMKPPHTIENTTVGRLVIPEGRRELEELTRQMDAQQKEFEAELRKQQADFEKEEKEIQRNAEERLRKAEEEARRLEEVQRVRENEFRKNLAEEKQKYDQQFRMRAEEDEKRESLRRQEEIQRQKEAMDRRIQKEEENRKDEELRRQLFEEDMKRREEEMEEERFRREEELEILRAALKKLTAPPDLGWYQRTINFIVTSFGYAPFFEKVMEVTVDIGQKVKGTFKVLEGKCKFVGTVHGNSVDATLDGSESDAED